MGRVVEVDPVEPDPKVIAEAADVLRRGGLVAIPTETVYGLAGRALDPAALARIFAAKGRPRSHPLIAHVASVEEARGLARDWPDVAERLAKRFFPGPLTLVVPRGAHVPAELSGGGDTVAVRAPAHPVARALVVALGEPIAAPSANRYQSVSPTTAQHVVRSLGERVELVLDAGPCEHGIESTVVDVSVSPPKLLRPGALPVAEVRAVVADLVVPEGVVVGEGATRASPGLDAKHYAPRANVEVVEGQSDAFRRAAELHRSGKAVVLIVRAPVRSDIHGARGFGVAVLGDTPDRYGAGIFAAFHDADQAGADAIVVEDVPAGEAWLAIRDRLRRARA